MSGRILLTGNSQPEELVGTGDLLPVLTTRTAQWKSFATDAAKAIHMDIAN